MVSDHAGYLHCIRRGDGPDVALHRAAHQRHHRVIFGTQWLATLAGFAFFSHQVGGFLGVWLGGVVFDRTGSYNPVWWLAILFGVLSAIINLPIVEKSVARIATLPA